MTSRSMRPSVVIGVLALAAALAASGFVLTRTGRLHLPGSSSPAAMPAHAASAQAGAFPRLTTVTVLGQSRPLSVPRSFLQLSTEYWTIPVWAKRLSLLGTVLSSLTPDGAMVLRIGGSSADQAVYAPNKELPEWAFEITPAWLGQLREIIKRFGVRVILDLNTVTASPQIAVRWARAAEAALPTESIVGFEIGNEPDIYSPAAWRRFAGGVKNPPQLPARITARSYASSFSAYAKALTRMDPGVPLLAPALAEPGTHLSWISQLLGGAHPGLRAVTVHRYPMSACTHNPSKSTFATIGRLLSDSSTAGMASTIRGAVRLATHARLPVRLTEINSVTCGGRKGVSDTFATALWAPDALFELIKAGASSVAVHTRANAINMAFSLTNHGLVANPLFYGLALVSRTLGPRAQLLPLRLGPQRAPGLKMWAVRISGNNLHVLLINKSTRTAQVALKLPATGTASIQNLLARTARSTTGVTLGGQHLDPQGRWVGSPTTSTVNSNGGRYNLTVRGISATLLTVHLS